VRASVDDRRLQAPGQCREKQVINQRQRPCLHEGGRHFTHTIIQMKQKASQRPTLGLKTHQLPLLPPSPPPPHPTHSGPLPHARITLLARLSSLRTLMLDPPSKCFVVGFTMTKRCRNEASKRSTTVSMVSSHVHVGTTRSF
jgi:hypothetical protein